MKKRKNKGFSLAEGAIALTVITIISASVTVLCMLSAKYTPKLYARFQASNIAADVVTCFKLACEETDQKSSFDSYLEFYVGNYTVADNGYYTYEFTMDSVSAEVTADFTQEEVTIKTYLGTQDSVLYSYGYSIADGEIEVT
ncbi:MAG: hypothetical protein LUI60_05550 [Clostridia bacterium]|nr:hypothetical protein [Clostridia bacterium]